MCIEHSYKADVMIPVALNTKALCAAVLLAAAWQGARGQNGPCTDATPLHSLNLRVAGYMLTAGEHAVSDYYIKEGWYSMGKYVIASRNVTCGTYYPWHVEGDLPTDNMETNLTTCNKYECDPTKYTRVIRCDDGHYVFYLKPLDSNSDAYCIEPTEKAANNSGLAAPVIQFEPVISTDVQYLNGKNNLHFYCNFQPIHRELLFTVEWILTSGFTEVKLLHKTEGIPYDDNFPTKTALNEIHLQARGVESFPFTIKCSVTAQKDIAGKHSNAMTSEDKFCGIKVVPKDVLYLNNGDKAIINVTLTVPFGCHVGLADCPLSADVFVPKQPSVCQLPHLGQIDAVRDQCGVTFYKSKFSETKSFTITGMAGDNNGVTGITKQTLLFRMEKNFRSHPLFSGYSFSGAVIMLNIDKSKIDGKTCYSHNDPHMLTFEGVQYENQVEGTYVLYKHKTYEIEVQVSSKKASETVSLNCGIAIRVGRDVFVYSICSDGAPEIGFRSCEDGVLHNKVTQWGTVYTIFLPTGSKVNIQVFSRSYVNFEVIPSAEDILSTTGLCGTIDNVKETPNPSDFRVTDATNLFERQNYGSLKSWSDKMYVCKCNTGAFVPGADDVQNAVCDAAFKIDCRDDRSSVSKLDQVCAKARKKRHTQIDNPAVEKRQPSYWANDDVHLSRQTSYSRLARSNYKTVHHVFKRMVYDDQSARTDCMAILNTTAFQMCSNLPNLDVTPYINDCITDAMLTNSMEYSLTHLEAIKEQCIYHVRVNQPLSAKAQAELEVMEHDNDTSTGNAENDTITDFTTVSTPAGQDFVFSVELLREIEDISCPNECNGNGQCLKGVCVCDADYIDIDCSVGVNEPPIMKGIPDLGLCDRQLRPCKQTSVYVEQIVASDEPVCRLIPFTVNHQSQLKLSEMSVVPAEVLSLFEVRCPLTTTREKRDTSSYTADNSFASGYKISLSNNGQTFSDEDLFVVFDSRCVDCTKNGTDIVCYQKPKFCVRGGDCYVFGEQYGCDICGGEDKDSLHWIPSMANPDCPVMSDDGDNKKKLWIIAAVLGPVVLVVCVIILLFCCKKKTNGKSNKFGLYVVNSKQTENKQP